MAFGAETYGHPHRHSVPPVISEPAFGAEIGEHLSHHVALLSAPKKWALRSELRLQIVRYDTSWGQMPINQKRCGCGVARIEWVLPQRRTAHQRMLSRRFRNTRIRCSSTFGAESWSRRRDGYDVSAPKARLFGRDMS
jgi:hypothetical protein